MEMRRLRIKDLVDRRYLGAIRFVDQATQKVVRRPMNIKAPGLKFFTNLSQFQIISYARGLEMHLNEFKEPPDQPDAESLEFPLIIQDPLQKYLPRVFTLKLPRKSKPEEERNDFEPIDIPLCPAANSRLSPNWSIIRASVYDLEDMEKEIGVGGALLLIIDENDQLIGSGLSDKRGEALLIIPGIPITNFAREEGPTPDDDELPADEEELPNGEGEIQPGDGELPSDSALVDELAESELFASGPVVDKETPAKLEIVVAPKNPWPVDLEKLEKMNADSKWQRNFKENPDDELNNQKKLKLKTGETQAIKLFVEIKDNA
jgi:hypothetical protein